MSDRFVDRMPAAGIPAGDREEINSPAAKARRRAQHEAAVAKLRPLLKPGDRIRAIKGECGASLATYSFAGWDGGWIVSSSGIDTIIPATVVSVNGRPFAVDSE